MELQGRVALVTGSARRLGREIALALARAGAELAIHHHASPREAAETAGEMRRLGGRAEVFQADLTDPPQIERLFEAIARAFGRLDILVNSAASFRRQPVLEITADAWDAVLDLNLRAPFLCSQHAARLMQRQGDGVIINIADVGAYQPWQGYAHHCVSKAGLVMLTRVLARALAPNLRVNAVAPGPVMPPDGLSASELEELAELTALKRLGSPEDVSRAVLYLIDADYVTGETLVVDGGKLLRG
jgi:NAD(P)-dependent dehydrogenase (short-subunit alcohol dehydrogenase family)